MTLDFEKDKLIAELKERKPKKVLVQLAEGIKRDAHEIAGWIEGLGIECIFSGESCWGACSVAVQEAEALGVDLLVHFGHAQFIEVNFPILYMEVQDILDLNPILNKSLPLLEEYSAIGLSYSIQHRHDIENVKKFYESKGKKVTLSQKAGTNAYEGHITGCEYRGLKAIQKDVEAFVILGTQFHSMRATLALTKPVILVDVYNDDVRSMAGLKEKILRQRLFSIEKFKEAENIGIIVEIKPGQKFGNPRKLLEKLKNAGKKAVVITMSEMTPDKVMNFYHVDAFVELACPRIALDDFEKYEKPILTMLEAMVGIGEKSWDDILENGIV